MAVGNTIGRIVGQSPASASPPNLANPIAQMFQGLQQLLPMWQQLQGLVQQLAGGGGGGGGGEAPAPSAPAQPAPIESTEALRDRLTELGRAVRVRPASMEGRPRPDQSLTRSLTEEIVRVAVAASPEPGRPVPLATLDLTQSTVRALAERAPSPAQAVQAVGNAATQAQGRGASPPVLQMLQQVMGIFQQALSLIQGLKRKTNGAQIKRK